MKYADKEFSLILYLMTALCFAASGYFAEQDRYLGMGIAFFFGILFFLFTIESTEVTNEGREQRRQQQTTAEEKPPQQTQRGDTNAGKREGTANPAQRGRTARREERLVPKELPADSGDNKRSQQDEDRNPPRPLG